MLIYSEQKFVLESPKKLREVARLIGKWNGRRILDTLPFVEKRASKAILKVINTAMANGRQRGLSDADLYLKEIQIGEGPRLKRGRAGARGRTKPYKRRMSHIRVVLESRKAEAPKLKAAAKAAGAKPKAAEVKPETKQVEARPAKKIKAKI